MNVNEILFWIVEHFLPLIGIVTLIVLVIMRVTRKYELAYCIGIGLFSALGVVCGVIAFLVVWKLFIPLIVALLLGAALKLMIGA
jgi:hypothetical protein